MDEILKTSWVCDQDSFTDYDSDYTDSDLTDSDLRQYIDIIDENAADVSYHTRLIENRIMNLTYCWELKAKDIQKDINL